MLLEQLYYGAIFVSLYSTYDMCGGVYNFSTEIFCKFILSLYILFSQFCFERLNCLIVILCHFFYCTCYRTSPSVLAVSHKYENENLARFKQGTLY